MSFKVLLVDDDGNVTSALSRQLHRYRSDWDVVVASSVQDAWACLRGMSIDVIVLDVAMPEQSGFDLLRQMASANLLDTTPVVMLTGLNDEKLKREALDIGASDLLLKPVSTSDLVARIGSMLRLKQATLQLKSHQAELQDLVNLKTESLKSSELALAIRLAKIAEMRDECTGDHVIRVARYSSLIATQLGWTQKHTRLLCLSAPLHDIGKIAIPDSILLKRGALTPQEKKIMQTHCELGAKMLQEEPKLVDHLTMHGDWPEKSCKSDDDVLALGAQIALCHHERWDGRGYPRGIKGTEIPIEARIVALADAFDALTTNRPYRTPLTEDMAASVLSNDRGTHFDPEIVDAFFMCSQALRANRDSFAPSGYDDLLEAA